MNHAEVMDVQEAPENRTARLRTLHEAYVALVNEAVAANRPDLAEELAAEHDRAALSLMATTSGPGNGAERRPLRRNRPASRAALALRLRAAGRGPKAAA